jgi:4-amino-4-deoxy-L-arabinose transferase-like glycosyltransferase
MNRNKNHIVLVSLIILIALFVRLWGITYDLPFIYHPDEPFFISIALTMLKTGDLNPHNFLNPALVIYINSLAYIPYYLLGKIFGVFHARSDLLPLIPLPSAMGVTLSPMPTIILLGRIITVFFGVGTVGLTFLTGKQLTGKSAVGLLASLMVAISTVNVVHSRFVTPDTLVVFFVAAAFLAIVMVYQQGRLRYYLIAGLCIGFAASSKYYGGIMVLSLLFAHFLRYGKSGLKERNIYLALFLCGLGFLVTTPYALFDLSTFLTDLQKAGQTYATGHAGMEGNTLSWYLTFMWQTSGLISLLAILEILRGFYCRSKEIILLSFFPVVYFVFISRFIVRNDRTFLTLTPFLFLLAASFLVYLIERAGQIQSQALRRLSLLATASFLIVVLIQPVLKTTENLIQLSIVDSRESARVWINDNLPPGAKIAIESYSPFADSSLFTVQGFARIIDHQPDWYVENGFDYLVFGQGMYGRFYLEPERYSTEVSQYSSFFNQYTLLKRFIDGNYEVLIYKIK